MGYVLKDELRTAAREHLCDQCLGRVLRGERYRLQVQTHDGFSVYRAHAECDEAAAAYAALACLDGYDDWPQLRDLTDADGGAWLLAEHPAAAARLGWKK